MAVSVNINLDKSNLIKWFICLLVPVCIWLTSVNDAINYTADLRMFFVITAFCILLIAFDFFDPLVPAVFLSTAYFLSGIAPMNVAFGSWVNDTVWMILGALLLAKILDECGLLRRIALWSIKRCGGTYNGALYGLFIAGFFVNMITFGNGFIIMLTLGYGVCKAMNLELSRESSFICVATVLGALTPLCFIYNSVYNSIAISAIRTLDPAFTIQWYEVPLYLGIIMLPLCFLIIWVFTKLYHTNKFGMEGQKDALAKELSLLPPMSIKEKKVVVIISVLVIYLLAAPLTKMAPAWGFMVIPYLFFLPGINVADAQTCKKLNWSAMFFMASCLCIGTVSQYLGASKFISLTVTPLLEGHGTLFAFCCLLIFGTIAHLFMPPYAMMAALTMPFIDVGMGLGIKPVASLMTLQLATDMVFFPYEAAASLIMYGFGFMTMKDFLYLSSVKIFITMIAFLALIYPYWHWLGFFQ